MNRYRNTYELVHINGVAYYYIVCYTIHGQVTGKILIDSNNLSKCQKHQWHIENMSNRNLQYAAACYNRGTLRIHRFLTNAGKDAQVDHINHNGLDNRMANLRICSLSENNRNKDFSQWKCANKLSVGIRKIRERYFARIMVDKKEIALGGYSTLEEAILARRNAEIKYFKEYRYSANSGLENNRLQWNKNIL